jgi:hypothetical protein
MAASHSPAPSLAADEAGRLTTLSNRANDLALQAGYVADVMMANDTATTFLATMLKQAADIAKFQTLKELARESFRRHLLQERPPTAEEMGNVEELTQLSRFEELDELYNEFRPLVLAVVQRLVSAGPEVAEPQKERNTQLLLAVSERFQLRLPVAAGQVQQAFDVTVKGVRLFAKRLVSFLRTPTITDYMVQHSNLPQPVPDYGELVAKFGMGEDAAEVDRLWLAVHSAIKGLARINAGPAVLHDGGRRSRRRKTKKLRKGRYATRKLMKK